MSNVTTSSVDPREVAYYESLADTWWDRQGPFWPLHRLNELRAGYILETLCRSFGREAGEQRPLRGLTILDVGCGGGILSESMARLGAEVHGIDVVSKNIAVAEHHASATDLPVRYETITAEALREAGAKYDVVLNMEVVEHVPDAPGLMRDCARMVKQGGMLYVATINRTLLSFLFAIVGAEYVLGWLPRGTHRWKKFIKPSEVERTLRETELVVSHRVGVQVNPLTRNFSLTSRLAVNYMLGATRA